MALPRPYDGYRSFDYLDAGDDYRAFDLAPQVDRTDGPAVPLDDEQEERVDRLSERHPMIAFHEHAGVFPADIGETPEYVRQGRMATAFEGLAASRWDAVFDNLTDGICQIQSKSGWKWDEVLYDLGMRLCDLAHQDFVRVAGSVDEMEEAWEENRVAWVPSIEGAAMIENEVDRIDVLHGFGVRVLGVTYSEANALGSGLKEERDGGLTAFGRDAVERMNKVGMLIDCSHAGDRTTLDTVEVSEKPVVLTHIGARALWDSRRLAPDEVLEAVARSGGVIGIEAAPLTTLTENRAQHGLASVMEHFEYVRELVGIDHVTLGADTVYGDHVGLHQVYAEGLSLEESQQPAGGRDDGGGTAPGYREVPHVQGIENPTEASENFLRWLVREGYDDEEIAKVAGGNVLRVLREAWA
jgi:membrane dipeptidase